MGGGGGGEGLGCWSYEDYGSYSFQASKKYLSVARLMKQYEDKKFELWREQVEGNLMSYLKRNLLCRPHAGSATTRTGAHPTKDDGVAEEGTRTPVQGKGQGRG